MRCDHSLVAVFGHVSSLLAVGGLLGFDAIVVVLFGLRAFGFLVCLSGWFGGFGHVSGKFMWFLYLILALILDFGELNANSWHSHSFFSGDELRLQTLIVCSFLIALHVLSLSTKY